VGNNQKTPVSRHFFVNIGMEKWAYDNLITLSDTFDSKTILWIETQGMIDWHLGKGKKNVDWEAVWRNWMRNWWYKYGGRERAAKAQNNGELSELEQRAKDLEKDDDDAS